MTTAQRWMLGLLAVIAAGVVAIAVVLLVDREPEPRKHTDEWHAAYDDAEHTASYYCTLGGVVPGMTSLHDPAYKQCVKDEAISDMKTWERENPDDVWE